MYTPQLGHRSVAMISIKNMPPDFVCPAKAWLSLSHVPLASKTGHSTIIWFCMCPLPHPYKDFCSLHMIVGEGKEKAELFSLRVDKLSGLAGKFWCSGYVVAGSRPISTRPPEARTLALYSSPIEMPRQQERQATRRVIPFPHLLSPTQA